MKENEKKEPNELNFEVDSALLSELGERLVGSVHVALLELVKNAYDADATLVKVRIEKVDKGIATSVVDNGVGMTLEDVQRYWMKIATNNKAIDCISKRYGRYKSGAKGIGRFSCRRLGDSLELKTTARLPNGTYQTTALSIDWCKFVAGTVLGDVKIRYKVSIANSGECGTSLYIVNSNPRIYSNASLSYIKRHCVVLVANRGRKQDGYEEDPGFNIFFRFFDENGGQYRNLREDLIDAGWGTVVGEVSENGVAEFSLEAIGASVKKYVPTIKFNHIAGASLRIGVLVDVRGQIRNADVLTVGPMRQLLSEWGGVYVRHNGVRVQPYGNPQDDWLNIDRDRGLRKGASASKDIGDLAATLKGIEPRRYLLSLLSSRSYVGDVEIDSSMTGFEIKASREGFLNTEAFEELRTFARLAVDFATLYRDQYVQQEGNRRLDELKKEFENTVRRIENKESEGGGGTETGKRPESEAVEYILKWTEGLSKGVSEEVKRDAVEGIAKAAELIQAHQTQSEEELRKLRLVASTSILLALFAHDVKSYLAQMDDFSARLRLLDGLGSDAFLQVQKMIVDLGQSRDALQRLVDFTLAIAAPGRENKDERLNVRSRLSEVLSCLDGLSCEYGVKLDISGVPNTVYVGPITKAEFFSLMVNVVSNAIKAVVARNGGGERKISVTAISRGRKCEICCRDNGIGVDLQNAEMLFSSFVSDPSGILYPNLQSKINKEHGFVLGSGSGLGLNIARQIVSARGGEIGFLPVTGEWRTNLRICL